MKIPFPGRVPVPDDPGEAWAARTMAPLRDRVADVDVAGRVMRRIAAARPAPEPAPLPARWAAASWAATLFLGFAAIALLMATAGVMAFGDANEAQSLWALVSAAGRLAAHGYTQAGHLVSAFWQVARALLLVGWRLADTAAPVARGAGLLAALAGLISIGISVVVVSRARRTAPLAALGSPHSVNGGLS